MKYIWGLDISTVKCGLSVLNEDKKLIHVEVIRLSSKMSLEERSEVVWGTLQQLFQKYPPHKITIESPVFMFGRGKSTAGVIAMLNCFSGMIRTNVYSLVHVLPIMIPARSARQKVGLKMVKTPKTAAGKRETKQQVIDWVQSKFPEFKYEKTKAGNFVPGTDDMADSVVIAYSSFC